MLHTESLESRRLLTTTVTFLNGVLTIEGTSGNDDIYVTVGSGNKLNVLDSGVNNGSFDLTSVKKIIFRGHEGNDAYYANGQMGLIPSTVDGGEGNDNLYCGNAADSIVGGAGDDQLTGNGGNDYMDGGEDDDNLGGAEGNDTMLGGAGNGEDLIVGGLGNDLMDGGFGPDRIRGGQGTDTVTYANRTNAVFVDITGTSGEPSDDGEAGEEDFVEYDVENIFGGEGNDLLIGTTLQAGQITETGVTKNNLVRGNGGNDTILGLDGNDTLDGGLGTDTLTGGDGNDTADYASRTQNLTLDLDGIADDGATGENDRIDADIENLIGGSGNDRLTGNGVANSLKGNAGNDSLDGALGKDTLTGNAGTDTADYSSRTTNLTLDLDGAADDGAAGENDKIDADVENLTGGSGNDTLTGNSSANTLRGGAGKDSLVGAAGNDLLDGGLGADTFVGGAGTDTVDYSGRTQAMVLNLDGIANDGAKNEKDKIGTDIENLTGGSAGDIITGNASANVLRGNAGNDTLNGGDGADKLYGDTGADKLNGQNGNDILYARSSPSVKDILDGGAGNDKAQVDNLDTKTLVEILLA